MKSHKKRGMCAKPYRTLKAPNIGQLKILSNILGRHLGMPASFKKIAYNRGKKNIKTEDLKNFTSDLCEVDADNVVLT